ncbi:hypothetical protein Syncc9605_0948 [Synechococcus sp. CC9605]|nr:hypothetical protein Syncc9605_0948 [Synechococcus sp. CC9605]
MIDVKKTFHCSERCPRISCKTPLGRRFRLGRVLFWSPLRPCCQPLSSEGSNPSLTGSGRQSVERSAAGGAEAFSCARDGSSSGLDFSLLRNLGLTVVVSVGAANENQHSHDRGDRHSGTDAQDAVRSTEVSRVQVFHAGEANGVLRT